MVSSEASAEEDSHNLILSYGWQAHQIHAPMFYSYILQSVSHTTQFYRGHTADLKARVVDHNAGKTPHTAKYAPWKLKFYAAFETLESAQRFERYLKTGSGHAFAKRHLGI